MTNTVANYVSTLTAAIESRAAYELSKNAANDSIQTVLKSLCKDLTHEHVASVLMQNAVSADFVNRQERVNNRYNVYAAQKVDNAARAALSVEALNHYSLAILRVACALRVISHKDAVAACSASVKHSDAARERVIKSLRYAKHVASNTATTQSSSSINALQTLNVLSESRDASNNVVYSINESSEAFQKLAARYELKLASAE
jgi:hypothetical protein